MRMFYFLKFLRVFEGWDKNDGLKGFDSFQAFLERFWGSNRILFY